MHCTFFITINDLFKKVLIISHMKSFYLEQCHSYDTQCLKIRKKWPLIVSLAVSNISFYQRAPKSLTRLQSLTNIFEVLFRTHNKKSYNWKNNIGFILQTLIFYASIGSQRVGSAWNCNKCRFCTNYWGQYEKNCNHWTILIESSLIIVLGTFHFQLFCD